MRIRRVRATPVNLPFSAPYRFAYGSTASLTKTIVEVETDEGLVGLGEGADGDTARLIQTLGERLAGLDPLDLNECERRCVPAMSHAPWDNLTALRRAFGAIEIALWDLQSEDHVVYTDERTLTQTGEEQTAFRFTLGGNANVTGISHLRASLLSKTASYAG